MKSILDPTFQYVRSVNTDIRKTFARLRRQQREERAARPIVQPANVRSIPPRRAAPGGSR